MWILFPSSIYTKNPNSGSSCFGPHGMFLPAYVYYAVLISIVVCNKGSNTLTAATLLTNINVLNNGMIIEYN